MITLKDNALRGKTAKIFFCIMLGLNLISACSFYLQYIFLQNAENHTVTAADGTNNDLRQQLIAILLSLTILGSIITFIMWFARAYKNLHALHISSLNFEPGWATGAWFVPFLNLGRPFVIMREMWEETQYYYLPKEEKFMVSSSAIVGWWWAFWLIGNVMGNISAVMAKSLEGIASYYSYTEFGIVYHMFNSATLIIAILMMTQMQGYEKRLKEYVEEQNNLPPESTIAREPLAPIIPSGDIQNIQPE